MDENTPEHSSPALSVIAVEKLKRALIVDQTALEDAFLAEVDLLMECMLLVDYATFAVDADFAQVFQTQLVPLSAIAHLLAGYKPDALIRLRSGENYEALKQTSESLVESLLKKFPLVMRDSPPLTPASIVSLDKVEARIARRVVEKHQELLRQIRCNGLRCIQNEAETEILLDLKEFSLWTALNDYPLPASMKERCLLIIKFEEPAEVHARYSTFSKNREAILKAAVIVLAERASLLESGAEQASSKTITARRVREEIDTIWPLVFPDGDGSPPLSVDEIERLLGPLIKDAKRRAKKKLGS